ncbi:restriction endonuclease subunit S [Bacillus inaquosorum]|uniref:restriction endonuclease subunit S n=1 Tax=Bacillus inaquosorum TaxID=483913 RepID=UPI002280DF68|nr:restriction endonuclease subunit S [Bacillus inaquosorum]MCY8147738.1 restriction endonuclease subunit S [Bacillus inaquosorum]MCY9029133.1 restriction endonuclease subunit S [Bacillus inaquosorum]MEC0575328.1 restriction endonuclease subunit S [Bacillus inaquosorum]
MGNKKTPEVQFLGFTGGWKQKPLTELVERVIRKNNKLESTLPLTISAQNGLVDQETFFNKKVASTNLQGYYLLYKGEFAYNKSYSNGYPFGAVKRLEKYDKGVLSSLYICFRPLNSGTSDFLKHYFESTAWHKEVSMISVEGARNHGLLNISVNDFFETLHTTPTLEEQKKIGDFFKQLDDTIALYQQELTTLKQTKQGFLQKMFPKEGESVPEVRFPGFTGDWEQRKLGELIEISSAARVHKNEWTTSGVRFFRSSDVVSKFNGKENIPAFISFSLYDELSKKSGLVQPGDILVTGGGSIGIPYLVADQEPLYFKDADLIWLKSANKIDGNFLYSYFVTPQLRKYISSITHIGTISHYTIEQAKDTPIILPEQVEQTLIGNFFKQLNDTITLHQRELDALKETKKAFLQKMFV